jgi:hypothetical protein
MSSAAAVPASAAIRNRAAVSRRTVMACLSV